MKDLGTAATYSDGTSVALVRMSGSLDALRAAEKGEIRHAVPAKLHFGTIAGILVQIEPQHYTNLLEDKTYPADYCTLFINLDGMVHIEIVSDADDTVLNGLLAGIDMAAVQQAPPPANPRLTGSHAGACGRDRPLARNRTGARTGSRSDIALPCSSSAWRRIRTLACRMNLTTDPKLRLNRARNGKESNP